MFQALQRTQDWLRQAEKDLAHAWKSLDIGDYEWSCFSAHQSAESAVRAVYESLKSRAYVNSVSTLLKRLPGTVSRRASNQSNQAPRLALQFKYES